MVTKIDAHERALWPHNQGFNIMDNCHISCQATSEFGNKDNKDNKDNYSMIILKLRNLKG